ncbi:MAG: S-methyl-5-thioribose-1-phosphate isomerase [Anaerovoracaceae bacterium]|jgi:methylthioribose-1-phosphate isomerase
MLEISPLKYEDGRFMILDQTQLPLKEEWLEIETAEDLWEAINQLKVRGAPAIGVAAAFGMSVIADGIEEQNYDDFVRAYCDVSDYIATSRPTAVNLFWALDRMKAKVQQMKGARPLEIKEALQKEAQDIYDEDVASCRMMGEYGLQLLMPDAGILTHCNAGALATAKYGTCLAPVHLGQERGYDFKVFADETRPLLQGARLTAWELMKAGVDVTLICDNMAASVMKKGWVDAVVVGCDRMAANGDGANKIGTSQVAIMAKEYGIPFYMFVPSSTIDMNTPTGDDIVIEEREGKEIYQMWYRHDMAPEGVGTFNPSFDVTDAGYITAVVTEKGIVRPPYRENLKKLWDTK